MPSRYRGVRSASAIWQNIEPASQLFVPVLLRGTSSVCLTPLPIGSFVGSSLAFINDVAV